MVVARSTTLDVDGSGVESIPRDGLARMVVAASTPLTRFQRVRGNVKSELERHACLVEIEFRFKDRVLSHSPGEIKGRDARFGREWSKETGKRGKDGICRECGYARHFQPVDGILFYVNAAGRAQESVNR